MAPNKFLAKIASGWKKPDGLTVVAPERIEKFLQGLPVDALWGVGPVTAARLREHGIEKLIDVRARSRRTTRSAMVGSLAEWLIELAHGRDDRAVEPNRPSKSAGSEETYATDLVVDRRDPREIDQMARGVAEWLGKKGKSARTVTIKVRYSDFTTITRSQSARNPPPTPTIIAARALSCSRKPRPAADRSACSASACTISAMRRPSRTTTSDARLPFS